MITLHLLRHAAPGPPDRATADIPLSARGLEDAEAIVAGLRPLDIRRIVSSPYRRAMETVRPYAEDAGIAIETDARLRERDMPLAESPEDHFEKVRLSFDDPDFSQPGGESFRDTANRALQCLRQLVMESPSGLLLVGHGQCLTLILRHVDPRADFDFWAALPTPAIVELTLDESCQRGTFRGLATNSLWCPPCFSRHE